MVLQEDIFAERGGVADAASGNADHNDSPALPLVLYCDKVGPLENPPYPILPRNYVCFALVWRDGLPSIARSLKYHSLHSDNPIDLLLYAGPGLRQRILDVNILVGT